MREQLIQYVNLLFAGARDCEDIHQEILQNTLDRYDDLITQGKVPEAAYRLAITGIGDINEILGTKPQTAPIPPAVQTAESDDTPKKKLLRAIAVALYILCPIPLLVLGTLENDMLEIVGLCGLLAIVAVATVLMMLGAKKEQKQDEEVEGPKSPLTKSISGLLWTLGLAGYFLVSFATDDWHITWVIFPILGALEKLSGVLVQRYEEGTAPQEWKTPIKKVLSSFLWAVGLAVYFALSFATGAWYITWLIFPMTGALNGLICAILDLKEAMNHET